MACDEVMVSFNSVEEGRMSFDSIADTTPDRPGPDRASNVMGAGGRGSISLAIWCRISGGKDVSFAGSDRCEYQYAKLQREEGSLTCFEAWRFHRQSSALLLELSDSMLVMEQVGRVEDSAHLEFVHVGFICGL